VHTFLNPRQRSLVRANILVLGSVAAAIPLSHYPQQRPTAWLILPVLGAFLGSVETVRCLSCSFSSFIPTFSGSALLSAQNNGQAGPYVCMTAYMMNTRHPPLAPACGFYSWRNKDRNGQEPSHVHQQHRPGRLHSSAA
jgi:hypothetical protein